MARRTSNRGRPRSTGRPPATEAREAGDAAPASDPTTDPATDPTAEDALPDIAAKAGAPGTDALDAPEPGPAGGTPSEPDIAALSDAERPVGSVAEPPAEPLVTDAPGAPHESDAAEPLAVAPEPVPPLPGAAEPVGAAGDAPGPDEPSPTPSPAGGATDDPPGGALVVADDPAHETVGALGDGRGDVPPRRDDEALAAADPVAVPTDEPVGEPRVTEAPGVPPAAAFGAVGGAGGADAPPRVVERVVERGGPGFVPLLLGGLLAAGLGYAVPAFLLPAAEPELVAAPPVDLAPIEAEIAALRSDVATLAGAAPGPGEDAAGALGDLDARVASVEAALAEATGAPADLSGLEAALAQRDAEARELRAALDALAGGAEATGGAVEGLRGELGALSGDVAALPDRLDAVAAGQEELAARLDAAAPAQDEMAARLDEVVVAQDDATGRLQEVVSAQDALSARLDELAAAQDALAARLEESEAEAQAVEREAAALARRATLDQIAVALEAGLPFREQLDQIEGSVPLALYDAAPEGVASLEALAEAFPEPARAALAEARAQQVAAAPAEERMGAWLRRQLDARSVEPREGDDPDAVLSRAEAAARAGEIEAALVEIEALPEPVRAPLAEWEAAARARLDAQAALAGLAAAQDTPD